MRESGSETALSEPLQLQFYSLLSSRQTHPSDYVVLRDIESAVWGEIATRSRMFCVFCCPAVGCKWTLGLTEAAKLNRSMLIFSIFSNGFMCVYKKSFLCRPFEQIDRTAANKIDDTVMVNSQNLLQGGKKISLCRVLWHFSKINGSSRYRAAMTSTDSGKWVSFWAFSSNKLWEMG